LEDKLSYIIKYDRFPFSNMDKIFLGSIFILCIALSIAAIAYLDILIGQIGIPLLLILVFFIIYKGYLESLSFKKITTGFKQEQNKMLVVYCLGGLNIKPFKNENFQNLFVCFVHDKNSSERQEIYIIAKENFVLIHSTNERESDAPPGTIDMLDTIGGTIYKYAQHFRSKGKFI